MAQVFPADRGRLTVRVLLFAAFVLAATALLVVPAAPSDAGDCPDGVLSSPGLPPAPGITDSPGLPDSNSPVPNCVTTTTTSTTTSTSTTTTSTTVVSGGGGGGLVVPPPTVVEPPSDPELPEDLVVETPSTEPGETLVVEDPTPPPASPPTTAKHRAAVVTATTTTAPAPTAEVLGFTEERPQPAPRATPRPEAHPAPKTVSPDRPKFTSSIPRPDDISWSAKHIGNNAWIAFLLVLLLGLPAEILNSSLKARQMNKPHHKRRGRIHELEARVNELPDAALLVGFGILSAIVYSELDPSIGVNARSALLVGALAAALIIITGLCEAVRIPYFRQRHELDAHLRMFPRALVIAVPLVIASRLLGFHPGFIFGVTCAVAVEGTLLDRDEGLSLGIVGVSVLSLGAIAWLLWIPASHAATVDDPSGVAIVLDTFLATLWVTALQVVLFAMLPLKYLYGEKVLQWSRAGWFAMYFTAMFLFLQVLLHPSAGAWGGLSDGTLRALAATGVVLLGASVAYWLHVQSRLKALATATADTPPAGEDLLV